MMATNKLNISDDKYDNNLFQSKLLLDFSTALWSQWTILLLFSKYLYPTYTVHPPNIHIRLDLCTLIGGGFLHGKEFLIRDE